MTKYQTFKILPTSGQISSNKTHLYSEKNYISECVLSKNTMLYLI